MPFLHPKTEQCLMTPASEEVLAVIRMKNAKKRIHEGRLKAAADRRLKFKQEAKGKT